MAQLDSYDPASPIQIIDGIVTTERSGIGKWGPNTKEGLQELAKWLSTVMPNNCSIAEIGSYAGEATAVFATIAKTVHAIDPWENGYDIDDLSSYIYPMKDVEESFYKRIAKLGNVVVHKSKSEDAVKTFSDRSLDYVYIDAIHKIGPCREDIKRWLPKVKIGGYIGGHDFCGYWGEVVDAVLESVGLPDVYFRDGSWAKRITN